VQYEAVFLQLFACHSNHANEHRGLRHDLERGDERSTSWSVFFTLQFIRKGRSTLNIAYEAYCGEGGFLTREECFKVLAAHGKQPEEAFGSLDSLNCKVHYRTGHLKPCTYRHCYLFREPRSDP
jgi:hypothetical protein